MSSILIALIPALCWGMVGIISTKMGGNAGQQTLGISVGALLLGIGVTLFYVIPQNIHVDGHIWIVGLLSGLFWSVGMFGQLNSFTDLGVSIGLPLSTAGQIVTNALLGASLLGEWQTRSVWLFGSISIILVALGAVLISASPHNNNKSNSKQNPKSFKHGLIFLVISTVGYMLYFIFPNLLVKVGFISSQIRDANNGINYMTAIVTPQAIGQVIGAVLILLVLKKHHTIFKIETAKNVLTGIDWATGNLLMFISAANVLVGQAMATTLSQMGVVVGTFGGIYLLHEKKTHDQMVKILIGTLLMIGGGVLMSDLETIGSWISL